MSNVTSPNRRSQAVLLLAIAFGLMVWGGTFLAPHLHGRAFVAYWATCAIAATVAVALSLGEIFCTLRALRQKRQAAQQAVHSAIQHAQIRSRPAKLP